MGGNISAVAFVVAAVNVAVVVAVTGAVVRNQLLSHHW